MKVFHDTRSIEYRKPYGAVAVGTAVELTVDVADALGAVVRLRTWVDGVGETLYEMKAVSEVEHNQDDGEGAYVRYSVRIVPGAVGVVWYQFVITDAEGYAWRYGAQNDCMGGTGQLVGWEPPSFALSVYDPASDAPYWCVPINGFLLGSVARSNLEETVATLLENYPAPLCATAAPWGVECDGQDIRPRVSDMETALRNVGSTSCSWFAIGESVLGFWRESDSGALTCTLFNLSPHDTCEVLVPLMAEEVSEIIGGLAVNVVDASQVNALPAGVPHAERYALVFLWQFGSAILHFHEKARIDVPMEPGFGVLAHITSLPMSDGRMGTLGAPARLFVDWLAEAGARYWQVLPVNPTDECGSPYAGISAFAGNTRLLEGDVADDADFLAKLADSEEYQRFCEREADWLEPYVAFMAIRKKVGEGKTWQEWSKKYRSYSPSLIKRTADLRDYAETFRRAQFAFDQQWKALRAYANEHGVQIIGDMPMYVSADSADVWAHPTLFQLDGDGVPEVVAGCPPDPFAVDGQIWGNPVYDWDALAADGYSWWMRRLRRAFELYDYVRLDHFIGFSRYFSIPVGEKAFAGTYRLGPGYDFFRCAYEELGPLPVVAEDLGLLTPHVRGLVADCGFPGMDIVQFADGGDPLAFYEPRPEKIVYTGTHDNQTLVGFVRDRYPDQDAETVAETLVEKVVTCGAPVRILPLQDIIGLGDEARMNVPGVAEGNWVWQAEADDVKHARKRARELAGMKS